MQTITHTRTHLVSPLGTLELTGTHRGVHSVQFIDHIDQVPCEPTEPDTPLVECARQLDLYFSGHMQDFHSLPLALAASDFQMQVWEAAMDIPYGETRTYGQLAEEIGHPRAARAVGTALKQNPLLLIVPCHRIIPVSATAEHHGGFAAGSWRKEWLLRHEKKSK